METLGSIAAASTFPVRPRQTRQDSFGVADLTRAAAWAKPVSPGTVIFVVKDGPRASGLLFGRGLLGGRSGREQDASIQAPLCRGHRVSRDPL